jgi:hypothetical protein
MCLIMSVVLLPAMRVSIQQQHDHTGVGYGFSRLSCLRIHRRRLTKCLSLLYFGTNDDWSGKSMEYNHPSCPVVSVVSILH